MALVIADTSALVSFGTVADHERSPLAILLDEHRIVVPEHVVSELQETASYEDDSGRAAQAVLDNRSVFDVRATELDETFPLDDGENAAVTLANDLDATQFLCDEFNQLALVHASLADTRLVTTPTFLTLLVRNGLLAPSDADDLLSKMSAARSWSANTYVARATATLQREKRP
jgi:predicted nucleic acid-binding protein